MSKFRQILTESAQNTPIFSFQDDNLSKCQRILTKFGTCIDIKEIWFGITNGQISSTFDRVICPRHNNGGVLSFYVLIQLNQGVKFKTQTNDIKAIWETLLLKVTNLTLSILGKSYSRRHFEITGKNLLSPGSSFFFF